jgi:hypothetical protein
MVEREEKEDAVVGEDCGGGCDGDGGSGGGGNIGRYGW